jgi:Flp pilus assembly protein TadB
MNLDDAKALWSSDPHPSDHEPADSEMSAKTLSDSEILHLVQRQSDAHDRKIRQRDWTESIAAAVVALFFGALAWLESSLLVTAGALLIIAGCVLIPWHLQRTRKRFAAPKSAEPVKQRLLRERDKLDTQIRLLKSVLWWYIAPLLAGLLLVTVGDNGWSTFTFVYGSVVIVGAVGIYMMNQRTVRNDLRPRRERLRELLEQVKESS